MLRTRHLCQMYMTLKYVYGCKHMVNSLSSGESEAKEKEQRRVEFSFLFLTVRTKRFNGVFDRLGAFRLSRYASWLSLTIVPIVAGVGLFLFFGNLIALLWNPAIGEIAREAGLGAILPFPGLNPYLPFLYGWFALIVAIVVHEGAHGIAARSLGLEVKSSGLLFFLIIPIGAFVDVDEEQIKKAKARVSSRVLAAGVGTNVVVAAVCLIGVLVICSGLTPVINGVYISSVTEGLPAEVAGLLPEDVFVTVDGVAINRIEDLNATVGNKTAGDTVQVVVARGDLWQENYSAVVGLTEVDNRTIMGVGVVNLLTEERLNNYVTVTPAKLPMYLVVPALAPGLVPFSNSYASFYTSPLGSQWVVFANTLFWLWFLNVNLAIFNALPIYPLDGGRIFNIALKSALPGENREKLIFRITAAVTITVALVILLTIIIPFIPSFL